MADPTYTWLVLAVVWGFMIWYYARRTGRRQGAAAERARDFARWHKIRVRVAPEARAVIDAELNPPPPETTTHVVVAGAYVEKEKK